MQTEATAIDHPAPVTFDITSDQIAAKRATFSALSADTPKGYESVRVAIGECRDIRVKIEKRRKELKACALEYGRRVDGTAKSLTAMVESLEEPLKLKKAAIDDEKARAKREKEEAERRAVEEQLRAEREAEEARIAAERAAEAERLRAEREELEKQRAQQEQERAAENARLAAEREKMAAERREMEAERERLAAAAAAERRAAEMEAQERARKAAAELEAERREMQKERERLAAIEAKRVAAEKTEREAARLEALKPDLEKLATYRDQLLALAADCPCIDDDELRADMETALFAIIDAANSLTRPSGETINT